MAELVSAHYKGDRIEPIEVITQYNLNFSLGCVIKYVLREKGNPKEDKLKAVWYLLYELGMDKEEIDSFVAGLGKRLEHQAPK